MKKEAYRPSLGRSVVLALGLAILPLSVVSQTHAKGAQRVWGKTAVMVADQANKSAELKVRLRQLLDRKGLKLKSVKVLPKGCGCAVVAPSDGWNCFSSCLSNYGVSAIEIVLCGASCAAAGTGIGAVICAICVGLNVTFIEFCALRCNMEAARLRDPAIRLRDNLKPIRSARGARQTRLTTNTVAVGS